jgi:DnaJ-class molecular chaperone
MAADRFGAFGASEVDAVRRWRDALGVPAHASAEEIKQAYRRAVKTVHPDLHPDDATAVAHFRRMHEAYEALIAIASRNSPSEFTDVWEEQFRQWSR